MHSIESLLWRVEITEITYRNELISSRLPRLGFSPSKTTSSSHTLNRPVVTGALLHHMLWIQTLMLWMYIFHNTWKSLTGGAALLRSHITAVLEQQWAVFLYCLPAGIWGHAPNNNEAPAAASGSTQGLCAVFERVSVHPMCRNMNILSLLPNSLVLSY